MIRSITLVALLVSATAAAEHPTLSGMVVSVTDGDTVCVLDAANVQLDGIDAPERGQPFSTVAHARPAALAKGKAVTVHAHGQDKYGRMLGTTEIEGQDVNCQMVDDGMTGTTAGSTMTRGWLRLNGRPAPLAVACGAMPRRCPRGSGRPRLRIGLTAKPRG
jgi:endonuclease YncB( thermonuclease family)